MKYVILFALAFYFGRRSVRHPLASHKEYMFAEYPDIMAFTLAEMKIDKFLLELENK